MTKILVTTDTSKLGDAALPHARALARALGAELVLLSVQPDPAAGMAGEFAYAPVSVTAEEMQQEDRELQRALEQVAEGTRVMTERAGGRSIARTILDAAQAEGASMIVMTTHGRSGLGRVLLGSVAEAVVHGATIPVLLVKGEQPVAQWPE
ncbi:universal stress protein [Deinococcus fonticola]|uniref:universal stress protein n=1 Tax=Deinococcus fonticola TaxID=2528713 RepID=UPI00107589EA|nr:universal stress protein [Deinococcus fonticola]